MPPGWPRDALNHPALTGLDPAAVGELAAALEIPYAARREHDLYTARGHPRNSNGGMRSKIPVRDRLLATLIHDHLGIQKKELAPAFGISTTTMSQITRQVTALLTAIPQPPRQPPPASPPQTLAELAAYAASHGITTSHPATPTPPQPATLQTPDTPQTHLILE